CRSGGTLNIRKPILDLAQTSLIRSIVGARICCRRGYSCVRADAAPPLLARDIFEDRAHRALRIGLGFGSRAHAPEYERCARFFLRSHPPSDVRPSGRWRLFVAHAVGAFSPTPRRSAPAARVPSPST